MSPRASLTLVSLASILTAGGCADRATPDRSAPAPPWPAPSPAPGPAPSPPPQPVGACNNEVVDAPCSFAGLHRIDPEGRPVPADAPADGDGTMTFSAEYSVQSATAPAAAVWVRAVPSDRAALERHFDAHRQARCAGEILRAPCPPGVHVAVQIPAPPVGTLLPQP